MTASPQSAREPSDAENPKRLADMTPRELAAEGLLWHEAYSKTNRQHDEPPPPDEERFYAFCGAFLPTLCRALLSAPETDAAATIKRKHEEGHAWMQVALEARARVATLLGLLAESRRFVYGSCLDDELLARIDAALAKDGGT